MGTGGGVHCTAQVQYLYPLYPQVKDAAYVKNFKQTSLATRLYEKRCVQICTATYENVPTRLVT